MADPSSSAGFVLYVFDGETGIADGAGKPHWDLGSRQLVYSLYADPLRRGSTEPANLVGQWFGSSPNPTAGPHWTSSSASMRDNDWWVLSVENFDRAKSPSGSYFYNLTIRTDGACLSGESLESNFKLASALPATFRLTQFGIVGGLRQVANDGPIVYPGPFPPPGGFLTAPSTYDGTFDFFFELRPGEQTLTLYDGDFDFGTGTTTATPSGVELSPCADTNDPNTPSDYAGFPLSTAGAVPEGAQGVGVPPDDNRLDAFRRGEATSSIRAGCVRYEVIDPLGHVYRNDNPSGSLEWEQFQLAASASPTASTADAVQPGAVLAAGVWRVRTVGLDLGNLNAWRIAGVCSSALDGATVKAACGAESVFLVGDTIWRDLNGDGLQQPGEEGIAGVVVELVRPVDGAVIATRMTGDSSSPEWSDCLSAAPEREEAGLYCFGVDAPGEYRVRVAAANFAHGGVLEALRSTTGGDDLTRAVDGANALSYDFGYVGGIVDVPALSALGIVLLSAFLGIAGFALAVSRR